MFQSELLPTQEGMESSLETGSVTCCAIVIKSLPAIHAFDMLRSTPSYALTPSEDALEPSTGVWLDDHTLTIAASVYRFVEKLNSHWPTRI